MLRDPGREVVPQHPNHPGFQVDPALLQPVTIGFFRCLEPLYEIPEPDRAEESDDFVLGAVSLQIGDEFSKSSPAFAAVVEAVPAEKSRECVFRERGVLPPKRLLESLTLVKAAKRLDLGDRT